MKEQPIIYYSDGENIRVHQLKTVEPYFSAVRSGNKTFEVRKFDRDFRIGDFLDLVLYNPQTNELGERLTKQISYILTDQPYVPKGYVILGMHDAEIATTF